MNQSSQKQVLYVDDESQALKYFSELFGDQFNVAVANSADEALQYIGENEERVAIVVTDQRMPEKTGVELMEHLRSFHPNIIRILTTAYSNLESAIKSVNEGGAFRYLTKPWNDEEMAGTLLRALEFHNVIEQRDQLMREKLSVLHRLVVMDRVRGLATMATTLDGQVRNAWAALSEYMQHSPVKQRVRLQMDEIAGMNMTAIAKRESRQMLETVIAVRSDAVIAGSGDEENVDITEVVKAHAESRRSELNEDDLELKLNLDESIQAKSDCGLLRQLTEILLQRLADSQQQPASISLSLTQDGNTFRLSASADFDELTDDQFATFFAAAIPLKKWPIGLDMDLLGAFMIAHHLGGSLSIDRSPPTISATLPMNFDSSNLKPAQPDSFDSVYASIEEWENSVADI